MQRRGGIARDLSTRFQTQIINDSGRFLDEARFYYPNAPTGDDKLVGRHFPTIFCHVRAYSFLYLYLGHTLPITAGKKDMLVPQGSFYSLEEYFNT